MKRFLVNPAILFLFVVGGSANFWSQETTTSNTEPLAAGMVKVVRHKVTVASNPTLGYDNYQIDQILAEMTQIANKS